MRCEVLAFQEKSGLAGKLHEDWCEELVEDGLGPCWSMERSSRCQRANRKADIEEAEGSSSRQEGVGIGLSLSEVNNLEIEEELSTMATLGCAEGCLDEKMEKEQLKAWRKQIFEDRSHHRCILKRMLDYVWMGSLLLIFDIVIEVLRSTNNTVQPDHNSGSKKLVFLCSKVSVL